MTKSRIWKKDHRQSRDSYDFFDVMMIHTLKRLSVSSYFYRVYATKVSFFKKKLSVPILKLKTTDSETTNRDQESFLRR